MRSDVGSCTEIFAATGQGDGLVAERGEGCESPEQADEQESAQLGCEHLAGVGQTAESANEEAAQQIHREGPMGKRRLREQPVYAAAECVAQHGSDEPSQANQKGVQKSRLQSLTCALSPVRSHPRIRAG